MRAERAGARESLGKGSLRIHVTVEYPTDLAVMAVRQTQRLIARDFSIRNRLGSKLNREFIISWQVKSRLRPV